jgi:cysteinyl-tRNA synthetase
MRRIMTDYLHYNVLYQINTTDIDDKIILRARQNVLLANLEKDTTIDLSAMQTLADQAMAEARQKTEDKLRHIESVLREATDTANSRVKTEQETLLEQTKLKQRNLDKEATAIAAAQTDRAQLLQAAKSVLAEMLDRQYGHTVTDHAVFNAHSRKYEREFMDDLEALGIRPPDVLTRVTEYIPQIIQFIEKIVQRDMAYESNGSVYLSIDNFKQKGYKYRKLSPAADQTTVSQAEMAEGEGVLSSLEEKRNPNDFALWKASKPGEPAWESPWGAGRPGWHIECSVVASDILGEVLDIHAGGEDLKFPHHDNELAQSEACWGCNGGDGSSTGTEDGQEPPRHQWVNYFTHTGHLHIEGLKMSKSLKNFITIRQALENNTARQLRLMFLLQAWDQPMNYSDQTVEDARAKESTLKAFFREMEAICREDYLAQAVGWRMPEADRQLADVYLATQQTVHESLLDNFNTKDAMLAIMELIRQVNVYLRTPDCLPAVLLLRAIAVYVTQILKVFGVCDGNDDFGFTSTGSGTAGTEQGGTQYIETMVNFRQKVRDAALAAVKGGDAAAALKAILGTCDELRDEVLPTVGVRLEDRNDGTRWNLEDPAVMMKELADKKARETEMKISKLEKKLTAKNKELEKLQSSLKPPQDLFRTDEFKDWDADGVSITMANGDAVSDKQKKKKKAAIDKQKKLYDALMEKSGGTPQSLVDTAQKEVDDIQKELSELSL